MDMHYRLIRQSIDIAVSKALKDMQSDSKRSVRNLIDLGLFFAKSENQKGFFNAAKKMLSKPANPYFKLVARMITEVNQETIKTVGINLGYNSLTYGANKLRKAQKASGISLPWMVVFDVSKMDADFLDFMEQFIRYGRALGIYCYVFHGCKSVDMQAVCSLTNQFAECVFVLAADPQEFTERTAILLKDIHNMIVLVRVVESGPESERCAGAFRILRGNRCFFGFQTRYSENNLYRVTAPESVETAILHGNLFGLYTVDGEVSKNCKNQLYHFVCSQRGVKGKPLVTFDWNRDIGSISKGIQSDGGYTVIDSLDKAYYSHKESENRAEFPILEVIKESMSRINTGYKITNRESLKGD